MYYFGLFGGMLFAGVVLLYKPDTRYVYGFRESDQLVSRFLTVSSLDNAHFAVNPTIHSSSTQSAFKLGPWPRRKNAWNHPETYTNTSHRQTLVTPTASRTSTQSTSLWHRSNLRSIRLSFHVPCAD